MINNYFGFTKNPFARDVASQDMFSWKEFKNLKMRLDYFVKERGIFLLTGLIGSGKTTALKYFSQSVDINSYSIIYLNFMFDGKRDFYRTILNHCHIVPSHLYGDSRNMLRKYFLDMYNLKKTTPVLILDEAQNLPGFIMEEIRLLSNFDYDSSSPVLIILSGHKLLQQRMALNENEALRQRVTIKYHIQGLKLAETIAYIQHRLLQADSTNAIFTDSVLSKIHEESQGVLRNINNICNSLLLSAVINEKKIIDDYLFEQTKNEWR